MNSPLPQVVLLDLDDTIVHFTSQQPNYWRLACEQHLPPGSDVAAAVRSIEAAASVYWSDPERAFWGRQNMVAARRLVAQDGLSHLGLASYAETVGDTMTAAKEDGVRPIAGAVDCLRALRTQGHRLGLLTNGSSEFQRRKLQRYDLEPFFELILVEGELGFGKPDARVFERALDHFSVSAQDTVMIGDNLKADIGGAQALGIPGIWNDAHATGLPEPPAAVPFRVVKAIAELAPTK